MARYLHVLWHHEVPDDPVVLHSEIVDDVEVRKVELYADGRTGWAGPEGEFGGTGLSTGEGPFPSDEENAAQPEFTLLPTDAAEFERAWSAATGA